MPAYDQPIKFELGRQPVRERFAAVLEFESVDRERIEQFLASLYDRGITKRTAALRAFDVNMTSPELYFP